MVVADAANEGVAIVAAEEAILTCASLEDVMAPKPGDIIIAIAANKVVGFEGAHESVVARAAFHECADPVIPVGVEHELVVAGQAVNLDAADVGGIETGVGAIDAGGELAVVFAGYDNEDAVVAGGANDFEHAIDESGGQE